MANYYIGYVKVDFFIDFFQYTCCNCGNNFCSKCCNQKVPKSKLGATGLSSSL